ncbi:hypothetical protein [Paenibacillus sp. FSL H3-0333]|uniref:hypothetical protein n=1 Tax=Paenibacillus sp. FSL H3-0333 TaxID=2921373 RepID=UPI0030F7EA8D
MVLIAYRKDTNEVVHYVDCDGVNIDPSLFGLYHACLKYICPDLKYEDFGEYYVDESVRQEDGINLRDKIIMYSKIKVIIEDGMPKGLDFIELSNADPLNPPIAEEQQKKIEDLENIIQSQQRMIDEILKKLG